MKFDSRLAVFAIAVCTAAVSYRLGGTALWAITAVGYTVASAIAAYALWQDELLVDVIRPKGLDISSGALVAAAIYIALTLAFNLWVAPAGEMGGLLRRCTMDGARFPRSEVHGITVALEWVRGQTCVGYARSLGLTGPARGLAIVAIAALEELTWRGGVQQALAERLGSTRGWLVASALYGAAHFATGNFALGALALIAGTAWGALYRYRGRLAPGIFSHAVFSYFLFAARPLVAFT